MNISPNDIPSNDPIDKLIFEKGLRIHNLIIDKTLDLLVLILNNGELIKTTLSQFKNLNQAKQDQLQNWTLISSGIGIHWSELDEDLSLKGFIKDAALTKMLNELDDKIEQVLI